MNQPLPVEGNFTATVYSVESAGNTSDEIVITVVTDLGESPATLTNLLTRPLEQMLEEAGDINGLISFTVVTTERYGMYNRMQIMQVWLNLDQLLNVNESQVVYL